MTLSCWMMVERYPNCKEEVGGLILGYEISAMFDCEIKWSTASCALALAHRPQKNKNDPTGYMLTSFGFAFVHLRYILL